MNTITAPPPDIIDTPAGPPASTADATRVGLVVLAVTVFTLTLERPTRAALTWCDPRVRSVVGRVRIVRRSW